MKNQSVNASLTNKIKVKLVKVKRNVKLRTKWIIFSQQWFV